VPKSSAVVPGAAGAEAIAIAADHVGMVKFASPTDKNFRTVAGHLGMMASQAPGNVFKKWRDNEAAARGSYPV